MLCYFECFRILALYQMILTKRILDSLLLGLKNIPMVKHGKTVMAST